MRFALLILLSMGAPTVWSQIVGAPEQSWELIHSCTETADADSIGVSALEQDCPGIQAALTESGYAPFLSELQQEQLSVDGLVELQHLAQRYAPARFESGPLRIEYLDSILASLQRERLDEAQLSWWDRLEQWLRGILGQQQQDHAWFAKWIEKLSISEFAVSVTLYVLVALLIVLAVGVVVNEMRVAGVLRRRRREANEGVAATRLDAAGERVSLADLDRVSPRERVSVLLRMLVTALVTTGRLRAERSLTHRELGRRASFADSTQRECFERIALTAERLVYGRGNLDNDEIEPLLREGRALHARLLETT